MALRDVRARQEFAGGVWNTLIGWRPRPDDADQDRLTRTPQPAGTPV